jgi:hypothetical protein
MREKFRRMLEVRRMRRLFARPASAMAAAGLLAIAVNPGGGPGANSEQTVINWLAGLGLGACVIGVIGSAISWAVGHHTGSHKFESGGKVGVIAAVAGAVVIGGAAALVNFGHLVGTQA